MVGPAPHHLIRAAAAATPHKPWAAILLVAAGAVAAQPAAVQVTGQCRDGQPQGGYAVRTADGRLRVQGAFNQGQRTGSFFFWSDAGTRIAQLPFDADALSGTVSLWYDAAPAAGAGSTPAAAASAAPAPDPTAEPQRRVEAAYRNGRRDGATRWWYPNGHLRAEVEYAAGDIVAAKSWSEAGTALGEVEARAAADAERADTEREVAVLVGMLRRHPPDCRPAPPAQRAAAPSVPPSPTLSPEARSAA